MPATKEETMATKKKTTRATGRKTKASAAKKTAAKADLVVFALRMTLAERTKLHKTAGPRATTRLARAVLVAAANRDESAFRAAMKAARGIHR